MVEDARTTIKAVFDKRVWGGASDPGNLWLEHENSTGGELSVAELVGNASRGAEEFETVVIKDDLRSK